MPRHILSIALVSALVAPIALAEVVPLDSHHYSYPAQIPYKVDTDTTGRGPQFGFTLCNSTTQNQNSDCQLAMINSIDDFCLWGPPNPNSLIADEEAETVAWCTKSGHGTRVMPAGTITGLQFLKAPAYVQVVGTINQVNVNIPADDDGGELDPHGADERGNPLGSLVYSNAFPSNNGNNNTFQQVIEWHNFMGSQVFCFKACDYSVPNSKVYCNNIFDRTGCNFVAPAAYAPDVFETCDSDNMDPVGVYTSNGQVLTYTQPAENVPINTLPSIKTPASSNCVTYASSNLFANAPAPTGNGTSSGVTSSSSSSPTGTGSTSSGTGSVASSGTTSKGGSTSSKPTSAAPSSATSNAARSLVARNTEAGIGAGPILAVALSFVAGLGAVVAAL